MLQGTKFLFCLYSLIGTQEQECLGQNLDGAAAKAVPMNSRQGRKGTGTPAAATAGGAVLRHV